jgi:ABC-type enterochelin transport system permease subunit
MIVLGAVVTGVVTFVSIRAVNSLDSMSSKLDSAVELGRDNKRVNDVQAEILRVLGNIATDHEGRIRENERRQWQYRSPAE